MSLSYESFADQVMMQELGRKETIQEMGGTYETSFYDGALRALYRRIVKLEEALASEPE